MNELKNKLSQILAKAQDKNIASALSLFVGNLSGLEMELHQGQACTKTIYDLASLTKILGTTLSLALLSDEKKISLTDAPFAPWPHTSIASLLAHTSGLPAHVKLYQEKGVGYDFLKNRPIMLDKLFTTKPSEPKKRLYSDLGFIAMGQFLEQHFKQPLFDIFTRTLDKLHIENRFFYCPSIRPTLVCENSAIAPTGSCAYRKINLKAQVHDRNCFFLGGLAGHAGLFGTLSDVKNAGLFLLKANLSPTTSCAEVIRQWAQKGLGFFKPDPQGTHAALSPQAFGHYGFTGVSLWVDPQACAKNGVVIALLTNRVKNGLDPNAIFWLRKQVCDAVLRAV